MSRRTRLLLVACLGLALCAAAPAAAGAHPLGNFTVNHLTQVRISEGEVQLHYILDQAEIPTFQEIQRSDADGDGTIGGDELRPLLDRKLAEIAPGLVVAADGRRVPLGPALDPTLEFPPGQGGLLLTRVEATFEGTLPEGASHVEFQDNTYSDRVGWRAIQVLPGEGTAVTSSVPAMDPTDGLRAYPQDLLQSPPDVRDASFAVSRGAGEVTAPGGEASGPVTTDRAQDGFAGVLASGDTHGFLIVFLLAAAFGWGALHALSPGHGKSMVAGYLVGSRGTPRHAAILGLTVTVTHTAAVFALALVTLLASEYVLPEDLYPWLGVGSGAMVVAIGLAVMRSRYRRWRALRAADAATPRAPEGTAGDDHGDGGRGHHHGHGHGHGDGHPHRPSQGPITTRTLVALGVSGGIVPCPSALVVLIGAISQHRVGLGLVLILAFSLGLAMTLTAVGLAVLYGGRVVARMRPERRLLGGRLVGALPAFSATVIVLAGALITMRAIPQVG